MTTRRLLDHGASGYALLAVLWICAGVASSTLLCLVAAREAIAESRNRAALVQAEWEADGCLSRARAAVERALRLEDDAYAPDGVPVWQRVDRVIEARVQGCNVTVVPSGTRFDINMSDGVLLARTLHQLGVSAPSADSLAAAILDWIDADDVPRPLGAEADWYRARALPVPPNRPLVDIRELSGVRGVTDSLELGRAFGVGQDIVSISHATAQILELLPGLGGEIAQHIVQLRDRGVPLRSFADLGNGLPTSMQLHIQAALPDLARVASLHPASWVLTAQSATSASPTAVAVEIRIQRQGGRVVVVRRSARSL